MSKLATYPLAIACLTVSVSCFTSTHADVAVNFPLINNTSAPELTGYVTQDIEVYTTNDWTVAGMILTLDSGSIYQDASPEARDWAPHSSWIAQYPSLAFDTYVGMVDISVPFIAGPSGDLGSTLVDNNYLFDTTGLDLTWANIYTYDYGMNPIGRLSLSNDAQGTLRFALSESSKELVEYEFNIIDGQVIPNRVCDLPGDDGCGYDFLGLEALDNVLTHWNQNVPKGDLLQGDYVSDGYVGLDDLDVILSLWNTNTYVKTAQLDYNLNDPDGYIGLDNLDIVLVDWNRTVPPAYYLADPTEDGYVGQDDLNAVLSEWNAGTPPTALPEPASILAITLAAPLLLRRVRR